MLTVRLLFESGNVMAVSQREGETAGEFRAAVAHVAMEAAREFPDETPPLIEWESER